QAFMRYAIALLKFVVMLFGESVELVFDDVRRKFYGFGWRFVFELQQKAFLKIACANSGGLEFMYNLQDAFDGFFVGVNRLRERHVVNQILHAAADVTHIVNASYKKFGDFALLLSKHKSVELVDEILMKRYRRSKRADAFFVVIGVVVGLIFIIGG